MKVVKNTGGRDIERQEDGEAGDRHQHGPPLVLEPPAVAHVGEEEEGDEEEAGHGEGAVARGEGVPGGGSVMLRDEPGRGW